ncbi:MAG: isopentenyl-diphosphate Delta-isomerase [Flavobacteriales bacterium]|jgi:isopentenyl-diphosphate Delta-isomerase|nr:isopentenyl-diphosphate Delta-isomerase [Flavobacteriales bacterium]MDP4717758.1 isopentenyl-diphosphate Delta-isomerase [Flavobacteriales bacterium]MDP4731883.1 isopentenyl-diphosphate Delta-isomerase [Flavobacteriales bacterium]MDP4818427.1 isopentenyl-diphosphate Delta-isomerase [Flavobacteriales bacterium]MDP4951924.1 isopentenyl-diphosphate Delta-isomerase [Flavobacteriales bacterium]
MEYVVLVDEQDNAIGTMEKQQAHVEGVLHRAFSIFIFNSDKKLLLQKRASTKYHCGGLWTNTCCSHPRETENITDAANRRLLEEMGMQCELKPIFSFLYKAEFDNGLTEHEFDHVFFGQSNQVPELNLEEVEDFRYIGLDDLQLEIKEAPQNFTPWFLIALDRVTEYNSKQS